MDKAWKNKVCDGQSVLACVVNEKVSGTVSKGNV